jgi:hypothetical protein
VLEPGIDTATAEGRAMFGMLSVLAELQRELIVANTRDGLAAARARGRTGGRRPRLSLSQARHAQQLYDGRQHTVQQIADLLRVPRSTVYSHLDKATTGRRSSDNGESGPATQSISSCRHQVLLPGGRSPTCCPTHEARNPRRLINMDAGRAQFRLNNLGEAAAIQTTEISHNGPVTSRPPRAWQRL